MATNQPQRTWTSYSTPTPLPSDPSVGNSESDIDVSHILGNVPDSHKRLAMKIFSYYTGSRESSFGAEVGKRLRLTEMNVWSKERDSNCNVGGIVGKAKTSEAQTVVEITVSRDMCNTFGTLHGACATYIVDPCAVSALVVLGAAVGIDGTGVSQSMNLIWHQPAKMGTKLKVISNTVFIEGRIRTARCEIWDKNKENLYVSAVHSTVNNSARNSMVSPTKL